VEFHAQALSRQYGLSPHSAMVGRTMNRTTHGFLLIFTVFTILSCAHQANTTADQVAANTEIEALEYQPGTWVSGPKMGNRYEGEYHLRGNLSGRNITYYQLVFLKSREIIKGPAFYKKSFDREGNELPMVVIKRQAWPYETFTEVIGVRLTRENLTQGSEQGLKVSIVGRGDRPVVIVPPFYVTGFLNKVDEITKEPRRPRRKA
jgi:hypothetical protein